MSKHETPLTRKSWKSVGGTPIEDFSAVISSKTNGRRLMDGIIILNEETRIARENEVEIKGKDIIVVTTKANRLRMLLMG
jgi:hypothetical protein